MDGGSSSSTSEAIVDMIRDARPTEEILNLYPTAYKNIEDIERTRSLYRDSDFMNKWRDLQVTYIFGKTGSGKTRSVMEKYGYSACYRVTDYKHPFDNYDGQDVLIFEEFRGSLKHGDMLVYLDGYPVLLPCRYFNRTACFTKVFIISNIPPDQQYPNIDEESRAAFYRRIHKVIEYGPNGPQDEYSGVDAYINRHNWVQTAIRSDILEKISCRRTLSDEVSCPRFLCWFHYHGSGLRSEKATTFFIAESQGRYVLGIWIGPKSPRVQARGQNGAYLLNLHFQNRRYIRASPFPDAWTYAMCSVCFVSAALAKKKPRFPGTSP